MARRVCVRVFFGGFVVEKSSSQALLGSLRPRFSACLLAAASTEVSVGWRRGAWFGDGITNVLTIMRVSNVRGRTGQVAGSTTSRRRSQHRRPDGGGLIGKIFGPQAVFVLFIPLFVLCAIWLCVNSSSLEVYHE